MLDVRRATCDVRRATCDVRRADVRRADVRRADVLTCRRATCRRDDVPTCDVPTCWRADVMPCDAGRGSGRHANVKRSREGWQFGVQRRPRRQVKSARRRTRDVATPRRMILRRASDESGIVRDPVAIHRLGGGSIATHVELKLATVFEDARLVESRRIAMLPRRGLREFGSSPRSEQVISDCHLEISWNTSNRLQPTSEISCVRMPPAPATSARKNR